MLDDLDGFEDKFTNYKCNLTPDQIRRLSKIKPTDLALLVVASTFAAQNPGVVPSDIGVAEMDKDIALAQQLAQVEARAQQISDLVRCSLIAVMSDGFAVARQIYRVEKAKGRTPANAAFLDAFGQYFDRGPSDDPEPDPAPPAS